MNHPLVANLLGIVNTRSTAVNIESWVRKLFGKNDTSESLCTNLDPFPQDGPVVE